MNQKEYDLMLDLMRRYCEIAGSAADDLGEDSPLGLRFRAKESAMERAIWALQDSNKYPAHKYAV